MKQTVWLAISLAGCAPAADPAGYRVVDNVADAMGEPATPERGVPIPGAPHIRCDAAAAAGLVGRVVDPALRAEARRRTGARAVRAIAPGTTVTMDYRPDRLDIDTDAANRALRFRCG